jgi:hypothetical protein
MTLNYVQASKGDDVLLNEKVVWFNAFSPYTKNTKDNCPFCLHLSILDILVIQQITFNSSLENNWVFLWSFQTLWHEAREPKNQQSRGSKDFQVYTVLCPTGWTKMLSDTQKNNIASQTPPSLINDLCWVVGGSQSRVCFCCHCLFRYNFHTIIHFQMYSLSLPNWNSHVSTIVNEVPSHKKFLWPFTANPLP